MKKFYLVITLFICFFVFSLETNAESQDNITTSSGNLTQISLHNKRLVYNRYNNYPPQYNNDVYNITMPFMGYNFTLSSMSSSNSLKFFSIDSFVTLLVVYSIKLFFIFLASIK